MRIFEDYEISFHLDAPKPQILTHWGGMKNRIRIAPSSVLIKWSRSEKTKGQWECVHLTVFGERVHKSTSNFIGIHYIDYGLRDNAEPMPEWVTELLDRSHPDKVPA